MSDVVVARIQNRRGLRRDLPQPLAPGELGFCTDTGELYIGNEVGNSTSLCIETYTPSTATNQLINTIGVNWIVQLKLKSPLFVPPTLESYPDDGNEADTLLKQGAVSVRTSYVIHMEPDPVDPSKEIEVIDSAISYIAYNMLKFATIDEVNDPADLDYVDSLGLGSEPSRFLIDTTMDPSNEFIGGSLNLDESLYTKDDSYRIAEAINDAYYSSNDDSRGLVTVSDNVLIWSRPVDINLLGNDIVFPTIKIGFTVKPSIPSNKQWNSISYLSFDVRETDVFILDYSVTSGTNSDYIRTGTMRITATATTALLTDHMTEVNNGTNINLTFRATKTNNIVIVEYATTGVISDRDLYLSTNARRWKSF